MQYEDVVAATKRPDSNLLLLFKACGITPEAGQVALNAAASASGKDQHENSIFSSKRLASLGSVDVTPLLLEQGRGICARMGVPWSAFQGSDIEIDTHLPGTLSLTGKPSRSRAQ